MGSGIAMDGAWLTGFPRGPGTCGKVMLLQIEYETWQDLGADPLRQTRANCLGQFLSLARAGG